MLERRQQCSQLYMAELKALSWMPTGGYDDYFKYIANTIFFEGDPLIKANKIAFNVYGARFSDNLETRGCQLVNNAV